MHKPILTPSILALALALPACGDDGGSSPSRDEVVAHYAHLVHMNYVEALETAQTMDTAIDAFIADPTDESHAAAREAWLAARIPYGQTEVFRFQDGPIDDADGPEGQINAWPLDEAYIDYVVDGGDTLMTGIVNDTDIELTAELLKSANEGGEGDILGFGDDFDEGAAISTGYHAIEFLLWGQDRNEGSAGMRPHTDFLEDGSATAPNGDRRKKYLGLVSDILVDDLQSLVDEWADGGPYRATFLGLDEDEALTRMLSGAGILSKGELAAERMDVALGTGDQEDEHSCFSDNTHIDIQMNARGIDNLYFGRYGDMAGPSVADLVRDADPDLADQIESAFAATDTACNAIPAPFDQAIAEEGSDGWNKVDAAVDALFTQGDLIVEAGLALDLPNVSVELPE